MAMGGVTIPPRLLARSSRAPMTRTRCRSWASLTRPCSAPSCSRPVFRASTSTRSTAPPRRARSSRRSSCCARGMTWRVPRRKPSRATGSLRARVASEIAYRVRRAPRATRPRSDRSASRRRGGAAAARRPSVQPQPRVAELRPWIGRRLSRARRARGAVSPPEAGMAAVPLIGRSRLSPSRGDRACIAAGTRCSCPRRGRVRRRWSAGTGVPRARRSRRASTARPRAPGSALHEPRDPQPAHALGELRRSGRDELQLASAAWRPSASSTMSSGTRSATSR